MGEKRQVVVIHGGETFKDYKSYLRFLRSWQIEWSDYTEPKVGWKKSLGEKLGEEYQVILPDMPCKWNAKYGEWQIWFEKFVPHLAGEVVFVGHSLGGTFLTKYLSENKYSKKIRAVFLVAPAFEGTSEYTLADFTLPAKLNLQTDSVMIYHSSDDPVVPYEDLNKYSSAISNAVVKQFGDRGHFNTDEFPEIVEDIKRLK